MLCPECKGKTRVSYTRTKEHIVHRRRICTHCDYRFSTEEWTKEALNMAIDKEPIIETKIVKEIEYITPEAHAAAKQRLREILAEIKAEMEGEAEDKTEEISWEGRFGY